MFGNVLTNTNTRSILALIEKEPGHGKDEKGALYGSDIKSLL